MVQYTVSSVIHRQDATYQRHFHVNYDETTRVKSKNSNTNLETAAVSGTITTVLQSLKDESVEFGHEIAGSLFKLLHHPAYLEYLDIINNNSVSNCSKFGDIYQDVNGHTGFKPVLCGHRNECMIDGNIYTNKLAGESFELLQAISDKYRNNGLGFLHFTDDTFTLPMDLNDRVTELGNEGIKLFRAAVSEFYTLLYGGLPAVCLNNQSWGTGNPLKGSFNHFHCYGLNLCYERSRQGLLSKDRFYTVNPYVDTDLALSVWYGCVSRLADKLGVPLEDAIITGDKSLVWNHEYLEFNPLAYQDAGNGKKIPNYSLIKHAINYDMRKPVGDIIKFLGSDNYKPYSLTVSQKERLMGLIHPDKNKKNHVWIGWIADGVKQKYLSLLNLYAKTQKELKAEMKAVSEEKLNSYICPICGDVMEQINNGIVQHIKTVQQDAIILNSSMRNQSIKIKRVVDIFSIKPVIIRESESLTFMSMSDLHEMESFCNSMK